MKHVFYTHSAITTRLCLEVVEHLELAKEDVIWLTARNESIPAAGASYCVEDFQSDLPKKGINFLKCRMSLKKWRRQFSGLMGGHGFTSYIPQTHQVIFQLITMHPKCAGYYLVEEGMAAYCGGGGREKAKVTGSLALKSIFRKVFHFLNYGKSYRKNRPIQDCYGKRYRGCFCWNKHAFEGFKNKQVLCCPFSESKAYPDVEALVILDAVVEAGLVDASLMGEALGQLFIELQRRGVSRVGVKLHPETSRLEGRIPYWWEEALDGMEDSFSISWISRDFVVEELAMRDGLPVFVNLSSVGLYAAFMGREVVSIARLIAEHSPPYADYIAHMPRAWNESVNYLSD